MPKGMAAVVAVVLVVSMALPVPAQTPPSDDTTGQTQRSRGKQAREATRIAARLNEAATTYAEIVELTVADRADAVRLRVRSARVELRRLRPFVSEDVYAALERGMAEMEEAEARDNLTGTALAATENFKVIFTTMDGRMRRTPLAVWLHTYAAFKLVLHATAAEIDWPAVGQAVKESEKSWIALRRMVRDTNLRVLLSEIQSGLRDAVARSDVAGVKFAARLQIGSIGVLRDLFNRMAQAMARGR